MVTFKVLLTLAKDSVHLFGSEYRIPRLMDF